MWRAAWNRRPDPGQPMAHAQMLDSGGVSHAAAGALPVPWQQRREVGDLVPGDAREHVCKPSLRINIIELASLDQRQHDCGTLTAAIGARKQPRLAPKSNSSQRALGGIVAHADPAVFKKARECIDAPEHVIHGLGDIVVTRELGTLLPHPDDEIVDQWSEVAATCSKALSRCQPVD